MDISWKSVRLARGAKSVTSHITVGCRSSPRVKNCKATKTGLHSGELTDVVTANASWTVQHKQVLLMTCRVQILGPDTSTMQARALMDCALSTSFITEQLAQRQGLKRRRVNVNISGIGGNPIMLQWREVDFRVTCLKSGGRQFAVQAIVLRKVTSDLTSSPTPFNDKWKHLSGLELADSDFGIPGAIDLILGTEIFGQVVLRGWLLGPHGSLLRLRPILDGCWETLSTVSNSKVQKVVA